MNNKTNIEEDIKEINVIITTIRKILGKNIKITDEDVYTIDGRQYIAIENILKELERLKQENKEIKSELTIYKIYTIQENLKDFDLYINENYISKQVIQDIVDYVKNEIHFSREFCEDNVFVTLRIEPIERIIEDLEQKDKGNLSYVKDLAELQFKANAYDRLVEEIKNKIGEMDSCIELQKIIKEKENNDNPEKYYFAKEVLQELLE